MILAVFGRARMENSVHNKGDVDLRSSEFVWTEERQPASAERQLAATSTPYI